MNSHLPRMVTCIAQWDLYLLFSITVHTRVQVKLCTSGVTVQPVVVVHTTVLYLLFSVRGHTEVSIHVIIEQVVSLD